MGSCEENKMGKKYLYSLTKLNANTKKYNTVTYTHLTHQYVNDGIKKSKGKKKANYCSKEKRCHLITMDHFTDTGI